MNLFKAFSVAIAVASVAVAFFVYPLLPAIVPVHWNAAGNADGFGQPWQGAFIFPLVICLVLLLFALIPKVAVFKKNFAKFERQYWMLAYALALFFMLFYGLTLLPNFGYSFNMSQLINLPLGMLFISLGILMPSFKRNFFVGIRTPWSLANDRVWEKTHRFGGKAFVLAGLLTMVASPFPGPMLLVSVAAILVAAAASVIYSYVVFRKHGKVKI